MSYNLFTVSGTEPTNESDISASAKLGFHIVLNASYGNTGGQATTGNNNTLAPILSPTITANRIAYTSANGTYLKANQAPTTYNHIPAPYDNNWVDKVSLTGTGRYLVYWVVPSQNYYAQTADAQLIDASTGTALSHKISAYSTQTNNTNMMIVAVVQAPIAIGVLLTNTTNFGYETFTSMFTNYIYVEEIV